MTKKKLISVSLESARFEHLESYAKSKGLTLSSVVRIAVYDFLDKLTDSVNAKNEKTT